jgi:hypothetical protein
VDDVIQQFGIHLVAEAGDHSRTDALFDIALLLGLGGRRRWFASR